MRPSEFGRCAFAELDFSGAGPPEDPAPKMLHKLPNPSCRVLGSIVLGVAQDELEAGCIPDLPREPGIPESPSRFAVRELAIALDFLLPELAFDGHARSPL